MVTALFSEKPFERLGNSPKQAFVCSKDYAIASLCEAILEGQGWYAEMFTEHPPDKDAHCDLWLIDFDDLIPGVRPPPKAVRIGIVKSMDPVRRWKLIENGCLDYLIKPFPPAELLARLPLQLDFPSSHLERSCEFVTCCQVGRFWFDAQHHTLTHDTGRVVALTPGEARLLARLCASKGNRCSLSTLQEDLGSTTTSLRMLVRRLRIAIEPDPENPQHLLTVEKGYRLKRDPVAWGGAITHRASGKSRMTRRYKWHHSNASAAINTKAGVIYLG